MQNGCTQIEGDRGHRGVITRILKRISENEDEKAKADQGTGGH